MNTQILTKTITAITLLSVSISTAGDWPNWRGPDYTGVSKETAIDTTALNSPNIAWQQKIGTGYSSISVASGKAYTMANENDNTDVIYCFDATTGKELWRHTYDEPANPKWYDGGCSATPTISGGKVYTISKTGLAFCLNADTGKIIWQQKLTFKEPTWGYAGSALILDDKVIYNVGAAGIALNKDDGSIIWQSEDAEAGYATPVPYQADGKTLICIFGKESLISVNPTDGKVQWQYPWKTQYDVNASDPIIIGNEIFISSGYNRGCALLRIKNNTPELVWESKKMRSQLSGPVLIDGYLYGFDDNKLTCLQWSTGDVKWTDKDPGKGALTAAGDKLIVISEHGKLSIAAASPDGFKPTSSAQLLENICWAPPTIANGCIYVHDSKKSQLNTLTCVNINK